MVTVKQSIRAVSVIILVLTATFISVLFAMYNANISLAYKAAELLPDNAEMLVQLDGKASMGNMIFIISMVSLGITSIVALIMYISRYIDENQASMGILKAMGYRNWQIARSYALFGLPVLAGAIPGFLIAYLLEPGFENLLNANVDMPNFERVFPLTILCLSIIAPAVFFTLCSVLTSRIKLHRPPLEMIRENTPLKTGVLARRYGRRNTNRPFLKELSSTVVRSNLILLFFVAFAGLAFGNQIQLGFAVSSMTDKALARTLEGVDYESNIRFLQYENLTQNDSQLPYTAVYGDLSFGEESLAHGELVILQSGGNVFRLLDADSKKKIELDTLNGVVVNDWMRKKYGLALGDTVTFKQNGNTFTLPIAAFERSSFGETVYCGYNFAESYAIIEHISYNGLYTTDTVSYDPQKHIFVTTVKDMRGEFQQQKETYRSLSSLFFVLGTLIGFITLQIALRVVVNANRKYIAMMKAYGYSSSERSRSVLGKYRPVAYAGFLVGTVYAYGILIVIFGMTAKTSNMLVPVTADIWAVLIAPVLFIVAYECMAAFYSHRINRVSLKELMTD